MCSQGTIDMIWDGTGVSFALVVEARAECFVRRGRALWEYRRTRAWEFSTVSWHDASLVRDMYRS